MSYSEDIKGYSEEIKAHWIKATLFLLILVALGVFVWWAVPPELFDSAWIEKFLQDAGWWAPIAFVLLRVAAILVTVVPNAPLDIAGGALFGPFWGTVYSLAGSEAGAVVCFLLARSLGREAITHLLHREITFCDRIADRHLIFAVLFARLEPVFSFALVSYGAGLTRMSLRSFALSTLVGMTPGTIILNYYGKSFFSGNIFIQIFLGLAFVILILLIPVWVKRKNPWGLYDKMTGRN